MNRRHFLAAAGAGTLTPVLAAQGEVATEQTRPNRIGVSSYSFWGFRRDDLRPLELNLDHAARMGFDGLEILQRQLARSTAPHSRRSSDTPSCSVWI